jgi:hypothetical protein
MFIKITWKNSKGEEMMTLVEHTKVQGFINGFEKREVQPSLDLPEEVTLTEQTAIDLQKEVLLGKEILN